VKDFVALPPGATRMPEILCNEIKRFSHFAKCRDTAILPRHGKAQAPETESSALWNTAKN
jgi:hypothetical protein